MTDTIRAAARLALALLVGLAFTALTPTDAEAVPRYQPTGYWLSIDDDGKRPRSVLHITKDGKGKVQAKIVKLFRLPDEVLEPKCDDCDEGFRGKRIKGKKALGLTIMWDVEYDEDDEWDDGEILDPGNGKTYSVKLEVIKGGRAMEVRGYLGLSLLGRTQTWHKVSGDLLKCGAPHQVIQKGESWKTIVENCKTELAEKKAAEDAAAKAAAEAAAAAKAVEAAPAAPAAPEAPAQP